MKTINLIMTPALFREFGIHVCDDQIINTYRYCPRKIKGLINKEFIVVDDTEAVEKKRFFKSLVKGQKYEPDLPRTKSGDKTTSEIRIVERARHVAVEMFKDNVVINHFNTDMPLISKVGCYNGITIWFEDVIDIFPANYNNRITAIIPYLTTSVESTYFSPSFPDNSSMSCWGEPRFINKVEALMIHHLYMNFLIEHQIKKYKDERHELLLNPGWNIKYGNLEVRYKVADIRPDNPGVNNYTELIYKQTPERLGLCEDIARDAAIIYNSASLQGWDRVSPNETSCANCPLQCKMDKKISVL